MDAKKAMVAKWLGSGKNVSVLVKEEHNTKQKLEEAGRVGYLKPGQVAEKMGIKIEYFPNSKEFKAGSKRECIYGWAICPFGLGKWCPLWCESVVVVPGSDHGRDQRDPRPP